MGPELYVFKYINGNIYAEETSHANVIVFYIQFYEEIAEGNDIYPITMYFIL
jgi:hypothetical protein